MFSFLPILPGDYDQSYHPTSQVGKLRHRSATPLLAWHRLSNPFGPGHTWPVPYSLSSSWILKQFSFVCISLSFSKRDYSFYGGGWVERRMGQFSPSLSPLCWPSGRFFARGRNWLSSCLGSWLTLQRAQDGSSHVLRNYFCVSFRGSNKGQHLLVWTPETDTSGHI